MTLFVAIGLAMDCFAVSLGIGTSPVQITRRLLFRISYHFGLFQGGMTLLGWVIGNTIAVYIRAYDHWIALALLAWVGIRMILEGSRQENCPDEFLPCNDPSRGKTLVVLSVATSIDAMAVGLSLAVLDANILLSSLVIGLVSVLFSLVGLKIGNRLSERFGKRMEILGGLILIFIGVRIVICHLFGVS